MNIEIYIGYFFFLLVSLLIYKYKNLQILWIVYAIFLGCYVGYTLPEFSSNLYIVNKLFIRSIKCIIGPLLFSTLVLGIAGHKDETALGRMAWKSILYFEMATTMALAIGLFMINTFPVGLSIQLTNKVDVNHSLEAVKNVKSWQEHIINLLPENFIKALAEGQILQIVLFTILFSIALNKIPTRQKEVVVKFAHSLSEVMFKLTGMIMYLAPICVFAAMAFAVSHAGLEVIKKLISLVFLLYASLVIFILITLLPIAVVIKLKFIKFWNSIKDPVALAFATTSSESALPKAMLAMEKYGVSKKVVSFVMPLGYSFNLDGTTLYLSLASVFVAQVSGIELSIGTQIALMLSLMLSSKGIAGVPRASLVILVTTLADFQIPEWPVMIMFGIDELMDMARSSVNVLGNCFATVVVGAWENEIDNNENINN
ncbi:MAG: cation:dicarboxylase symporter family transporter [Cytophagales bacterium]